MSLRKRFASSSTESQTGTVDDLSAAATIRGPFVDSRQGNGLKSDVFQPFPVDALPEVLRRFARDASLSIGCDPVFAILPALSVCGSAIGTTRQLLVKRGWFVPPVLWTVIIGESGTQKSPPFRMATEPLRRLQGDQAKRFQSEQANYSDELRLYKRDLKKWERSNEGEKPEAPVRPVRERCIVSDCTIEALAGVLCDNPRGVLLARDELSAWLAGFDKYSGKSAASSEVPKWLEIYNTESIVIDRKTGDERFLYIQRPSVSVCGGTQPGTLARCITDEHRQAGLEARLLMAFPPRQAKRWRDDEIPQTTIDDYRDCINELFMLSGDVDSAGESRPALLRLTDDGRELLRQFVNRHGEEQNAMNGHLASQWSKLEETPMRLSIVLHCVHQVTTGVTDPWQIDESTVESAVTIAEWFKAEILRIRHLMTESELIRELRQVAEWIKSKGGTITARDFCRNRRDIESTAEAEAILQSLVDLNVGHWRDIHKSRAFVHALS